MSNACAKLRGTYYSNWTKRPGAARRPGQIGDAQREGSMTKRLIATAAFLFLALVAGAGGLFLSGALTSRAVQTPTLAIDMVPAGNTYSDPGAAGDNSMTVGTTDNCLTSATANTLTHTHAAHVVIKTVEDLIGWQVRLNYLGDKMRPNTASFTPFMDTALLQGVSFNNLPIDQTTFVHRDLSTASNIPAGAPGPQTASFGAAYIGAQNFAISPDTPAKAVPDDTSYSAPSGGVLAAVILQVVGNQSGQPSLFMNLDD